MHLTSITKTTSTTCITKKANTKLNALTRVQKYMTPEQKTFLTSSYKRSPFNYYPLIWIFCSKKAVHILNNIHKGLLALYTKIYYTFTQCQCKVNTPQNMSKYCNILIWCETNWSCLTVHVLTVHVLAYMFWRSIFWRSRFWRTWAITIFIIDAN